ncbi:MAG: hypothetical protein KAJ19_11595 [Gammaproteobacteria bacterium]|nr:hypothetical protein [Gammaproteobacteria bacterium]
MGHDFSKGQYTGTSAEPMTASGAMEKLNLPPSANFLLCYNPMRWQIMGDEVLPCLHQLRREPGLDHVGPKNGGDMAPAIAAKLQKGWKIIPHDVIPGGYVRKFAGQRGDIHLTKWETPRQLNGRAFKTQVDREGYKAFLRDLIDRGIIEPPMPEIFDDLIARAQGKVDRAAPHTATEAGQQVYQRALQELEAVKQACGRGAPKPPPKKRRSRAKPKAKAAPKAAAKPEVEADA